MGIKKQAINDATDLFQKNIAFWDLYDKTIAKAQADSKYDEIFGNVYNDLLKKKTGNESAIVARAERAVKLRPSKKPAVVGVIFVVAGVVYMTGFDRVLLEKGKHLWRKTVLAVEGTSEEQPKHSATLGYGEPTYDTRTDVDD